MQGVLLTLVPFTMGVWSWDIIGSDSTLEFAMDLLTRAGVGPTNYAERRKTFAVVMVSVPMADGGQPGLYIGRHSHEEYAEFFEVLDQAADQHLKIEAAIEPLIDMANATQQLYDSCGDDCPAGHAMQVLGLILMQAGCLPPSMIDPIVGCTGKCCAPGEKNERAAHERRFVEALREYGRQWPFEVFKTAENAPDQIRGVAIKYRPRGWASAVAGKPNEPANISQVSFIRPAPSRMLTTGVASGEQMECMMAESAILRSKDKNMYTRSDEVARKLIAGKPVRFVGLVSRADLNGKTGRVADYNAATARYSIEVDNSGGRVAVKAANLEWL